MKLLLIPLEHAFPAIQNHMSAHPDDDAPSQEEMQYMAKLAVRSVMTARALEAYADALSGKPNEN